MPLSKKYYERIADLLYRRRLVHAMAGKLDGCTALGEFARLLAAFFEEDNPRFDKARFLKACGLED